MTQLKTQDLQEIIMFVMANIHVFNPKIEINLIVSFFSNYKYTGCEKFKTKNVSIEWLLESIETFKEKAFVKSVTVTHNEGGFDPYANDGWGEECPETNSISIYMENKINFEGWQLAFPKYELIGKASYEHREVLKKSIFVNMDGEKIMGVYHTRGFYTHKKITPMWVIAHNGQYYVVCYENDAPKYIGREIRCNHAIGFFSDETRKPEDMFRYLVEHPEYEICASLKTELVFGKAWVLVEGTVIDAFNHNMYSIVHKGQRVCNINSSLDRMSEERFEKEVNDEAWNKAGNCYHEIWLKNHRVVGVYDSSCKAVIKAAKEMGIPIIKMPPCVGYSMCD